MMLKAASLMFVNQHDPIKGASNKSLERTRIQHFSHARLVCGGSSCAPLNSGVRLLLLCKRVGLMDKRSFYEGKTLAQVEWWLSYCSEYPDLAWARLRVFSDGSADATFEESKVYGFATREYAGYFLSEDEYIPLVSMDAQDEAGIGAKKADISPPSWDDVRAEFEYLGTY